MFKFVANFIKTSSKRRNQINKLILSIGPIKTYKISIKSFVDKSRLNQKDGNKNPTNSSSSNNSDNTSNSKFANDTNKELENLKNLSEFKSAMRSFQEAKYNDAEYHFKESLKILKNSQQTDTYSYLYTLRK